MKLEDYKLSVYVPTGFTTKALNLNDVLDTEVYTTYFYYKYNDLTLFCLKFIDTTRAHIIFAEYFDIPGKISSIHFDIPDISVFPRTITYKSLFDFLKPQIINYFKTTADNLVLKAADIDEYQVIFINI